MSKPLPLTFQYATVGFFLLSVAIMIASFDVFAFENGARATISQVWLAASQRFAPLSLLLAVGMGLLLQHLSVARDPKHGLDPAFWPHVVLWLPFFVLGCWIGFRWLYQLPTQD